MPGPNSSPLRLPVLVTCVIREPIEPPTNWMPLPPNPLIVRALVAVAAEKTTLFTLAPITRPLVPMGVPVPSSASASFTATLLAASIVMPLSGAVPPTAPAIVTAPPADSVSLPTPSSVETKRMSPPARREVAFLLSITAPANVCPPLGDVTPAASWTPRPAPEPSVVRLTGPAPLATILLATAIVSAAPAPVSTTKPCAAAPFVTADRSMPPGPTLIASTPTPPATLMPVNPGSVFRFTAILSAARSTVMPDVDGRVVEIVPAVAALIVSTPEAAL